MSDWCIITFGDVPQLDFPVGAARRENSVGGGPSDSVHFALVSVLQRGVGGIVITYRPIYHGINIQRQTMTYEVKGNRHRENETANGQKREVNIVLRANRISVSQKKASHYRRGRCCIADAREIPECITLTTHAYYLCDSRASKKKREGESSISLCNVEKFIALMD